MRGHLAFCSLLLIACTETPRMQPLPPDPNGGMTEPQPMAADLSGVVTPNVDLAAAALTLAGITPTSGSTAGGYLVTITGGGFDAATDFELDGVPLKSVVIKSATQVTAEVQKSDGSFGQVRLKATNRKSGQVATRDDAFRFIPRLLQFSTRTDVQTEHAGPFYIAGGDFNGDGKIDLVTNTGPSNTVTVFLNRNNGTFAPNFVRSASYGLNNFSHGIAVDDMNGDGKLDLVSCANGSNYLAVFLGKGDGTFENQRTNGTGTSSSTTFVVVADFNGDNKKDLLSPNYAGSSNVGIFFGTGNGDFGGQALAPGASNYPYTAAVADLNGDGKPDFITGNLQSNNVGVFINNGAGQFPDGQKYAYGVGSQPHFVTLGDINNDGKPDIISPDYSGNTITLWFGKGDGTFENRRQFAQNGGPIVAAVADLNGDNINELIVTNHRIHTATVFVGQGGGEFSTRLDFPVGVNPRGIFIGPFNNDNKPDFVVANQANSESGNSLSFFMNDAK